MNQKIRYIIASICIVLITILITAYSTYTYSSNIIKSKNEINKENNNEAIDIDLHEETFSGLIDYVPKKEQVKKYTAVVTRYKNIPIQYTIPNVPKNRPQVGPTCWAVSAIGAVETTIANTGLDSSYGNAKRINPYHMIHALSQKIGSNKNLYGFRDEKKIVGGTPLNTLIYLTNGLGFTTSTSYYYNQSHPNSTNYSQGSLTLNSILNNSTENYQVKNIQILPGIDIDTLDEIGEYKFPYNTYVNNKINDIKNLIYSGKGVTITSRSTQRAENPCYREDLHTAYCPSEFIDDIGAHMTLIVGWDDNYSKENFKKTVGNKVNSGPPADGAWIIRNSYSYDGYYYISYYDYTTLYNSNIAITSVAIKDFDNIYQYNPSGCDADYNCLELESINSDIINVYEKNTNQSEKIKSISFYADRVSANNKVKIYLKEGNINSSNLSSLFSQENYLGEVDIPTNGFYTFDISPSKNIKITTNKFYVGLKPTYEYTLKIQGKSNSLMSNSDVGIKSGISYYYNGSNFNDLANYQTPSTAFVKLYTKNINEVSQTNQVNYTVKYYLEKLDGTYELKDTKQLTGIIGDKAILEDYEGFIKPTGIEITKDTTLIEYKYKRASYTVTLVKAEGIKNITGNGSYKYGETVTIDADVNSGYTWSMWIGKDIINTKKHTFTMPNNDVRYTAIAEVINTSAIKVDSVTIKNCPTSSLKIGSTIQLDTDVTPSDATNKKVIWVVSSDIVSINNNGKIKALTNGTATITAITVQGGYQSQCKITVSDEIKENESSGSSSYGQNNPESHKQTYEYKYIFILIIGILLLINVIRIIIKAKNKGLH